VIKWYYTERDTAIRGDYPNARACARERQIIVQNQTTETIKVWIQELIKSKKKDEKLKPNDIRTNFYN